MTPALPAGRYGYDALTTGDRIETGSCVVTAGLIDRFAEMTGDRFEIHMDDRAAQRHGFPGRVAHGLLVLSLVDGLKNQACAQFDAVASLGWNWTFSAPVFVGTRISACITIERRRLTRTGDRGILSLDFDVRDQDNRTVQKGTNMLLVYR